MNPQLIAAKLGCTVDQIRAQYAKNAKGLEWMADKAARTGKKVNGYSEQELRVKAGECRGRAEA